MKKEKEGDRPPQLEATAEYFVNSFCATEHNLPTPRNAFNGRGPHSKAATSEDIHGKVQPA
jgi:hypothetical protein